MTTALSPLPEHPAGSWSDAVYDAYTQITIALSRANQLLSQETDPLRLRIHAENIEGGILPLLAGMDVSAEVEGIPRPWLNECAYAVGEVYGRLQTAIESATEAEARYALMCCR
jgi:hypothetical protein